MINETSSIDQRSPHPTNAVPDSESHETGLLALQLLREMRAQRESLQAEHQLAAVERKSERHWRMFFQGIFFAAPLVLGLLYFLFFLSSAGFRLGPFTDVVGVVHIDGQIASGATSSADKIVPALERAFSDANVKGVVLAIDSPGGAPVESERITDAITSLKKKHHKPVVAVINNVGASAAYMIAMHADKVVAGKYSLVGSIGAIMAPWELHRAMAKLDVSQRVYASGKLKAFLNPFTPVSPEVDAKAKKLVDQMGQTFVSELNATRGAFLKPGVDYGSGEVWGGLEAKELGLVDAISTVDDVVATTWGLRTYNFGPHQDGFAAIASTFRAAVSDALLNLVVRKSFQIQ
ncbi:S49 family peptidase [Herbaspirillum sp. ST 5-3]|uniref:S49 family peptidase n=1 Tax=Oxalobacteraceae TaxID=75682 RepID=UPI001456203C|nr:S49 family peptidase [Herbaspirillum sp. ST 5-3]